MRSRQQHNKSVVHKGHRSFESGRMLLESDMTKQFDLKALAAASIRNNRKSGGGRGKSTDASQLDLLGIDGLQFIQSTMKKNGPVATTDLLEIGSEWFRKESVDWALAKKYNSAKTFTKVTVEDIDIKFIGGEVKRLSVILEDVNDEEALAAVFAKVEGFGEVYIKNEQFKCEWPLGDVVHVKDGDPEAKDLAPILAPWSLLVEACEKFAVVQ